MLFGVAVLTRTIYLFAFHPPLESYYLALADNLISAGVLGLDGRPSTAFEPVYPTFLAIARLLFGDRALPIQLLQVLATALGAPLLYRLTLHLSGSDRAAFIAGALFAVHPMLVRQASAASDLAVVTTLLIAFTLTFVRIHDARSAAIAGLLLGITVLTRSMVLPLIVLLGAILFAVGQRSHATALVLCALAVIAPMAARNYAVSGSVTPTRSGINLYIGNSPHTADLLPDYDLDLLEPEGYERFVRAHPNVDQNSPAFDAQFDAFLTRVAVQHMVEDPLRTIGQKLVNVAYLLSPRLAPYRISVGDTRVHIDDNGAAQVIGSVARTPLEVWSYAGAAILLLAGTIAGVFQRRGNLRRDAVLWAVALVFIAVNAIYVPATRYMAPMLFVMMFYTAVAAGAARAGIR